MKITERKLKQLVKEELQKVLNEQAALAATAGTLPVAQKAAGKTKSRSKPWVRRMQRRLSKDPKLGFEMKRLMSRDGRIKNWADGIMGRGTRAAIKAYRKYHIAQGRKPPKTAGGMARFLRDLEGAGQLTKSIAGLKQPGAMRGAPVAAPGGAAAGSSDEETLQNLLNLVTSKAKVPMPAPGAPSSEFKSAKEKAGIRKILARRIALAGQMQDPKRKAAVVKRLQKSILADLAKHFPAAAGKTPEEYARELGGEEGAAAIKAGEAPGAAAQPVAATGGTATTKRKVPGGTETTAVTKGRFSIAALSPKQRNQFYDEVNAEKTKLKNKIRSPSLRQTVAQTNVIRRWHQKMTSK